MLKIWIRLKLKWRSRQKTGVQSSELGEIKGKAKKEAWEYVPAVAAWFDDLKKRSSNMVLYNCLKSRFGLRVPEDHARN